MKSIILGVAVCSVVFLSGCSALGATPDRLQAGKSKCDPRSPIVVPFTPAFETCKANFPKLAADYEAKEDRKAAGKCDVFKGDPCDGSKWK